MSNRITHYLILAMFSSLISFQVFAENWSAVTGNDTLTELVSGAEAKIEVSPDVVVTGNYFPDGTAKIDAWGETFDRSWRVEDDERVCYSSFTETNCFTFEQDLNQPAQYRVRNVESGKQTYFQVVGAEKFVTGGASDDEGGLGSPSAQDIAAELSNPNSAMGTMNFQLDHIAFDGDLAKAGNQSTTRLVFQPGLPYPLSDSTNFFLRPAIPIILKQDIPDQAGGYDTRKTELGDIGFDASIGKSLAGGLVIIGGLAGTLPTATDDSLGLDQWLIGPQVGAALMRPWGVVGLLASHQQDVAGEDDYDTKITAGQYFYAFNLGGGWQINGSPTFSYNHEARDNDNKLTLPVAIGVSRTMILSGRPWKFGVQYWHYIESPDDFGPDFQLRFSISPVVSLPW